MQMGFFDLESRYASLSGLGDPLERLNAAVDWEIFRPDLERIDQKVRKSAAGCKPTCRVLMFKLLILQRLYGLSDERLEYQVRDRLSLYTVSGARPRGKGSGCAHCLGVSRGHRSHIISQRFCSSDSIKHWPAWGFR